MEFPKDLKYTKEHEWIRVDGDTGVVGITEYAQGELGDVVFVELPASGTKLQQGKQFGTIEAVKTVSDLFAPVSGEVVEVNETLKDSPEMVNKEPYGSGWMVKVKIDNKSELDSLLGVEKYQEMVGK
ncbi:MAG: glycine cleavage system protein GcvH [Bacteroidetes bacterium]|jgi:glycine cleavage system H protein|nr:glycine cleavage system protein GcvH [Bacteroidota bacterium]